jgi:2OG-Fe(II) oxygenase superfamily
MSSVPMAECSGLWRRTLLINADGSRDTGTDVAWLQGITAYVDTRGFAGRLSQHNDVFTWQRLIDIEPPGPFPDAGRMRWEAGALIEVGIGAHTDYECFTLLKPTAPGLEVLNGAGDWIDVPPVPDTFVVNIGDMLELWINGAYVATSHRVRKVKEERYSFPLFFNVDYHTEVKPLPQFASRDGRQRPTLCAGEHLFAQTAQTFAYLRNRVEAGELVLPAGSLETGQFGQEALQKPA